MKGRILPILLLILPFLYLFVFSLIISDENNADNKVVFLLVIWVILFVAFLISNIIFVALSVFKGIDSEFFLFWNMLLKLFHIPIYLLIFFIGILFVSLPGVVIFTPFLFAFDYMLLILTSIYGIGGLVQARREKKITTAVTLVFSVLHFVFCADVVCAAIAFCRVKSKSKISNINHEIIKRT